MSDDDLPDLEDMSDKLAIVKDAAYAGHSGQAGVDFTMTREQMFEKEAGEVDRKVDKELGKGILSGRLYEDAPPKKKEDSRVYVYARKGSAAYGGSAREYEEGKSRTFCDKHERSVVNS